MPYVCGDCIGAFELRSETRPFFSASGSCEICGPLFDDWGERVCMPFVHNHVVPRLLGSPALVLIEALRDHLGSDALLAQAIAAASKGRLPKKGTVPCVTRTRP